MCCSKPGSTLSRAVSGQHVKVHVEDENGVCILEGSDLLVAVGRAPNTHGIGHEQAGIKLSAQGFVEEGLTVLLANVHAKQARKAA